MFGFTYVGRSTAGAKWTLDTACTAPSIPPSWVPAARRVPTGTEAWACALHRGKKKHNIKQKEEDIHTKGDPTLAKKVIKRRPVPAVLADVVQEAVKEERRVFGPGRGFRVKLHRKEGLGGVDGPLVGLVVGVGE